MGIMVYKSVGNQSGFHNRKKKEKRPSMVWADDRFLVKPNCSMKTSFRLIFLISIFDWRGQEWSHTRFLSLPPGAMCKPDFLDHLISHVRIFSPCIGIPYRVQWGWCFGVTHVARVQMPPWYRATVTWISCNRDLEFQLSFFKKHITKTQILIYIHEHSHLWTYAYTLPLWVSLKDWTDFILRFIKSVTKSVSLSMGTSHPIKKIISYKYNTHIKSRI
jgi:hypothetical protein